MCYFLERERTSVWEKKRVSVCVSVSLSLRPTIEFLTSVSFQVLTRFFYLIYCILQNTTEVLITEFIVF